MRAFHTDEFLLPLPPEHRFPMDKYPRLREWVTKNEPSIQLNTPPAAEVDDLCLVHEPDYVDRVLKGQLDTKEVRAIGFPWSPHLVNRSLRSVGATVAASRISQEEGVAVNLAGGTHHAFSNRGEGYCVFNDCAVATRVLQTQCGVERVLIWDCDVHQGNGTANIFAQDASVFTCSFHGEKNYPFTKEESDLDIALPDEANDEVYLGRLREHLPRVLREFKPQHVLYLSGADPYSGDRLGRLGLSKAGLAVRDRFVFESVVGLGIPITVCMGGGYAEAVEDIVEIHGRTVLEAFAAWCR
ncbi:MAG: histone deacetylase [Candidatus Eisenbacteria bacterium]|uniref:Histone deacetylase n=1 Tax=Eiseniibacteriota bacterium TaxID=2212470 RepID=A0A7Y2E7P9_UNCEI|nr:histone deacetylase [Candidatus Eisenbacteria bacterium]